jgi:hypothetical protein
MCGVAGYEKLRDRIPLPSRQALASKDPVRQPEWNSSDPAYVNLRIRKRKTKYQINAIPMLSVIVGR